MKDYGEYIDIIQKRLSPRRFQHCLQAAQVAAEMAGIFGADPDKAYLTGLLHDYAKGISGGELLRLADEHSLIQDEVDRWVPDLLHAPVGAYLLRHELGITDAEILKAVTCHTMGALDMNALDKIIFLADMVEPGRDYPGQERLKCLAFRDLDKAMLFGLESTIRYCLDQGRILHPQTIAVRNHFLKRVSD
ncbi:bis(5'-nucleosyl)-tetraphosphatase (symmetrical) YqeK [Syntrophomonas palmitatica]|uniref:bis(5'-nucleosyl)-tetraphosphatase (symmetrical) YqeK n=1 Tax=Syntrophomonas palmitatica TaxID=402877 RepID=UPI0006D06248|nr:bis(5'-nucleosyl)-tetraphosphatase (symmetrical) YqeK [Syntrophomonas palmitatica]